MALVFFDTETTGLNIRRKDEILELGIVDAQGQTVMDQLIKPTERETWKSAQKVHGISPEDVADAPSFQEVEKDLIKAFEGNLIAIYNAAFDVRFLPENIAEAAEGFICVMRLFRRTTRRRCDYRLENAIEWANYSEGRAHRAVNDARSTLYVWNALQEHLGKKFERTVARCIQIPPHLRPVNVSDDATNRASRRSAPGRSAQTK